MLTVEIIFEELFSNTVNNSLFNHLCANNAEFSVEFCVIKILVVYTNSDELYFLYLKGVISCK